MSVHRGKALLTIATVAGLAMLLSLLAGAPLAGGGLMARLPKVILWAWERPEDLRFIGPDRVGVAFLAETLYLRGGTITARQRVQPLRVPPRTALVAVVRIESAADASGAFRHSLEQSQQAAARIADAANLPGVVAVQVDFDAVATERNFYDEVLREVRRELPAEMPLSITALASWCAGDQWLADLPVDEAVPMLFRMGPDRADILRRLRDRDAFQAKACRQSVGISTDEPLEKLPRVQRVYIFNPRGWTEESAQKIFAEVRP